VIEITRSIQWHSTGTSVHSTNVQFFIHAQGHNWEIGRRKV